MARARHGLPDLPWITKDGYFDMLKFPLDDILKDAVGPHRNRVENSLRFLGSASSSGRTEAGVFLMGLLTSLPEDDWELRIQTVQALRFAPTDRCAALLFGEIRRVRSSNTTRRYIAALLDVLESFPEELVCDEFEALAADKSFSYKMRKKFRHAAGDYDWAELESSF
ncbi:MAG: hypothetical protein V3V67_19510 [Myxococcota bacterium]